MALTELIDVDEEEGKSNLTASQKRRLRRKKLRVARNPSKSETKTVKESKVLKSLPTPPNQREGCCNIAVNVSGNVNKDLGQISEVYHSLPNLRNEMSSKDMSANSREDVLAARKAKKLNKQQNKKVETQYSQGKSAQNETASKETNILKKQISVETIKSTKLEKNNDTSNNLSYKGEDEVDRVVQVDKITKSIVEKDVSIKDCNIEDKVLKMQAKNDKNTLKNTETDKSREEIKANRAAKKAAKQVKKKVGDGVGTDTNKNSIESNTVPLKNENNNVDITKNNFNEDSELSVNKDITVKEVVDTLKDILNVAKDFHIVTDKVKSIDLSGKKAEESTKSKAELRAERRAKQESQRAAKQASQQKETEKAAKKENDKKAPVKPKTAEKPKSKVQSIQKVNWFQHLYTEHDKEALNKIALNSNLHPAIIKLGVQLASQVVTGSNARCVALLDALKKMVRDYSLPAKTEFARGLESHLAASLEFLWAMRQPSASQTNAVKHFRRQLTQLPNNVDEFDAKKSLQEEIDRYIREQIDMAGEAISIAVRNKISNGDYILTYGCSSLIERILCEAWDSGLVFRTAVVGDRVRRGAREMLRRLTARGLPCTYADISAVSFLMTNINKVILGAGSLLVNGSVLGPVGTAQVALVARAHNVPVLVACETHKFSERVQTDAFVYNEIGDPDDLIDKNDENSPLKDWRLNPNMTLLNLTYDVTPPSLVTAVVTELAILPCTSAPVVLRFKLSEYGM